MKTKDKNELNATELDKVSGGYLFFRPRYNVADKEVIEVIDDETGNVVETFNYLDEAREWAAAHGYSTDFIEWEQLRMMRVKGPKIGELPEIKGPQIGNPPMGQ
ncbi:MAG: hypothetical protein K5779_09020 [Saccharofermentans sp.]|nr:hypothetical protein [Saccharofermentans sp.]